MSKDTKEDGEVSDASSSGSFPVPEVHEDENMSLCHAIQEIRRIEADRPSNGSSKICPPISLITVCERSLEVLGQLDALTRDLRELFAHLTKHCPGTCANHERTP
jgi:hypothetical protein